MRDSAIKVAAASIRRTIKTSDADGIADMYTKYVSNKIQAMLKNPDVKRGDWKQARATLVKMKRELNSELKRLYQNDIKTLGTYYKRADNQARKEFESLYRQIGDEKNRKNPHW